jgi:TRL (tRNA-associated locus)-like protein
MKGVPSIVPTVLFVSSIALGGCGAFYTNVTEPHSYRSATPGDVETNTGDETATGTACSRAVLYLVAWGDGGYAAATHDALKDRTGVILYDVRTDLRVKAYALGAYVESCTIVTGKIGRIWNG